MTKKSRQKLTLRTETLRQLDPADLDKVVGGGNGKDVVGDAPRRTSRCNSYDMFG